MRAEIVEAMARAIRNTNGTNPDRAAAALDAGLVALSERLGEWEDLALQAHSDDVIPGPDALEDPFRKRLRVMLSVLQRSDGEET